MTPKEIAIEYLGEPLECLKTFQFGPCHITMWRTQLIFPPENVCVCEFNGEAYCVTCSLDGIMRVISEAKPKLRELDELMPAIQLFLPSSFRLVNLIS